MSKTNKKQTTAVVASKAGRVLSNPKSSSSEKAIAGSALSQANPRKSRR